MTPFRDLLRAQVPAPLLRRVQATELWNDLLAPLTHHPHAALDAWRQRGRFDRLERFLLFIGYARSGHTLLGSLLNAHRDALVCHELHVLKYAHAGFAKAEILALVAQRDRWFEALGRRWTGYDYAVPGQWQGRTEHPTLMGDKRGDGTSTFLARHPASLDRLARTLGVPLFMLHHVRDPFDNIATMALRELRTLPDAADKYFMRADAVAAVARRHDPAAWRLTHHEDLVAAPHATLAELASWLGLAPDPTWVEACAALVFPSPRRSRDQVPWTPALVADVQRRMAAHPHLARYLDSAPAAARP